MNFKKTVLLFTVLQYLAIAQATASSVFPSDYLWNTPSHNSSESMPCGGGSIGMNVWVENGDLIFYFCRSGSFDEGNTILKNGRVRIHLSPTPAKEGFEQRLCLKDGCMYVKMGCDVIQLWADVFKPVIHVNVTSKNNTTADVYYENWRYTDWIVPKDAGQMNSYKNWQPKGNAVAHDSLNANSKRMLFFHRNKGNTVFDFTVHQQGLDSVKEQLMNPIKDLTFGGVMYSKDMTYIGESMIQQEVAPYKQFHYRSTSPSKRHDITIALYTAQSKNLADWEIGLDRVIKSINEKKDAKASAKWWNDFWQRSYIAGTDSCENITRNYTLFRYMLGCNAYGLDPTKFNGGLLTFDPVYVKRSWPLNFTPDFRFWSGGTETAQNQRLVYWPMLKSGDFDMMKVEFNFYKRMLNNAIMRSKVYWGHGGACFTEQIENYGLPNPFEYGYWRPEKFDKGVQYNAWLEYLYDTVLEFCQMIIDTHNYNGADIAEYEPLIENSLKFFDEHYRYLAKSRGIKELDSNGKLILYPGSGCETYKMATNSTSTIAALNKVTTSYIKYLNEKGMSDTKYWHDFLGRIPPIATREINGRTLISPAKSWERLNNVEPTALYVVFPWRLYGIGCSKDSLQMAQDTYNYDPESIKFRDYIGWKQDPIWAADLGLVNEAKSMITKKLNDGPHRFPAFWGPGFDWTPDHNWGGSAMIALQDMLIQTRNGKIYLFPTWPKEWNVKFKLHVEGKTTVEAEIRNGDVKVISVTPASRKNDIIIK